MHLLGLEQQRHEEHRDGRVAVFLVPTTLTAKRSRDQHVVLGLQFEAAVAGRAHEEHALGVSLAVIDGAPRRVLGTAFR